MYKVWYVKKSENKIGVVEKIGERLMYEEIDKKRVAGDSRKI